MLTSNLAQVTRDVRLLHGRLLKLLLVTVLRGLLGMNAVIESSRHTLIGPWLLHLLLLRWLLAIALLWVERLARLTLRGGLQRLPELLPLAVSRHSLRLLSLLRLLLLVGSLA